MREAMRWLLHIRDNSVTEGDLADWTHWYESDPNNKAAFDQMQSFWMGSGALAAGPEGAARIRRLLEHELHAHAGETAARSSRRYHLALAASLAALIIVGGVLLRLHQRLAGQLTNVSLVRETVLPDGSRVELAPRSFLTVRYTPTERWVELRGGEAYFSVVHNSTRPFIVSVHDIQVRDVGTTFNIRDGGGQTVVTVATGAVDVYSKQPMIAPDSHSLLTGIRVTAGRELTWNHRSPPVLTQADPRRTLAWRHGRLDYIDEPLSGVIADVNRYLAHPVLIKDRSAGELAFTGTVMTGSAEEWVQALPSEFPVKLIPADGGSLLLASRPAVRSDSAPSR